MIESDVIWRGDRRHVISDLSLRDSFRRRSLPVGQSLLMLDRFRSCAFVWHEGGLAETHFDRRTRAVIPVPLGGIQRIEHSRAWPEVTSAGC